MNNWNRTLWIIFCITVISSIEWFSTVDALLNNIASLFGQANKHDQNRISPRFHAERYHKGIGMSPQRSIKSIRRCFCIESPPSTLSERFFGQRHFTAEKMPIKPEITNSMISGSQLSLIPSMDASYNQPLYFPKSSHVKIWRKGTKKSMSHKKRKHKQIQKKPKISHFLHQKQKHKTWKKSHSKILGHLKRVKHRNHHRLKCKSMRREKSKRSRKHILCNRKVHHKHRSRKSKRSEPHKLHYVKIQTKSSRKHEKKPNRSKSSIARFSSTPIRHYHYHFYKCLPIQRMSQKRHAQSLFFRRPVKKYQHKLKASNLYTKKRYTKTHQRSIAQRLPAYKVKRSYTRPGLSRTRYVYKTSKRSRALVPRISTFYRRMGNRTHYQKAYGFDHFKECAACRHRCLYDHSKYNTPYGRTKYANFIQNQQSLESKWKKHIGSSWSKRSNPYFESYMNYNNFDDSQSKRYAPYMFYQQKFPTSISSFQSQFHDNQPTNQYSGNMMKYQHCNTMFPTLTSAAHPYYYYSNEQHQYPSYNSLYTGLGMQSTNTPVNRIQGFETQPTYLQKAANFIHGILGTEQRDTRSTRSCTCPKSSTVVVHTNTNSKVSPTLSSGTNLNLGTRTKSESTSHSL